MAFTAILLAFAVILKTGVDAQYRISTQAEVLTEIPGKNVKLPCYIKNADKAQTLILSASWWKMQDSKDTQGEQVNNAINIQAPFTPQRFAVSLQESTGGANPGTTLDLTIQKVTSEDSGKYRCTIMENSRVVSAVTHTLKVYKAATSLTLEARTDAKAGENETVKATRQGGIIKFRSNLNGYIQCRASEVYPEPSLKMYIDTKVVTGNFRLNRTGPYLIGPTKYLQTMYYIDELETEIFRAKDSDHGKELRCELDPRVAGASTMTAAMTIQVEYKPMLNCKATQQAMPGNTKFQLQCIYKANPDVTKIQWTAQTTREVITTDDVQKNGLSASQRKPNKTERHTTGDTGEFLALLTFDKVESKHYQQYELQVTNALGTSTMVITLEKGTGTGPTTAASNLVPHITWMVLLLLTSFLFHRH